MELHPDEVVAVGAAMQGAVLQAKSGEGSHAVREQYAIVEIRDVLSHSMGVIALDEAERERMVGHSDADLVGGGSDYVRHERLLLEEQGQWPWQELIDQFSRPVIQHRQLFHHAYVADRDAQGHVERPLLGHENMFHRRLIEWVRAKTVERLGGIDHQLTGVQLGDYMLQGLI